jgi:hypothetical protein
LSAVEARELECCEQILRKGLQTFFEVAQALLMIREKRLYRLTHPTFEAYCRQRWSYSRSYAWRLLAAAERLQLLPPKDGAPRPAHERQMRPFLLMAPRHFPELWQQVVDRAAGKNITERLIRKVIAAAPEFQTQACLRKAKKDKARQRFSRGYALSLVAEAQRRIKKGETKQALDSLDRLETLLFAKPSHRTEEEGA